MRWLLRKDLLILGRSRLLLVLLVVYPLVIAVLIGLALSRGPTRASVAIVDETPPGEVIHLGGQTLDVSRYANELLSQTNTLSASSRAEAVAKVKSGEVLAAIVIPPDLAARVASGTERAPLEVIYNGNALEQSLVRSEIESDIAKANLAFSEQIQRVASSAIEGLLRGGDLQEIGVARLPIGLEAIPPALDRIIAAQPPGKTRTQLRQIDEVARFASENLDASRKVLAAIGQPIAVKSKLLNGRRTPLNTLRRGRRGGDLADVRRACCWRPGASPWSARRARSRACCAVSSRAGCCSPRRCCWPPCARSCWGWRCWPESASSWHWDGRGWGCGCWRWPAAALAFAALGVAIGALAKRGARRVAAGAAAVAAAGLPGARAGGVGGGRTQRRDRRDRVRVPVQGRPGGARMRGQRHRAAAVGLARAPARPHGRLRRDRAVLASPARARASNLSGEWPFHRRACAGCARAPACAGWSARPTCAPGSWCCRCSSLRRRCRRGTARADRVDARGRSAGPVRGRGGGPRGGRARRSAR